LKNLKRATWMLDSEQLTRPPDAGQATRMLIRDGDDQRDYRIGQAFALSKASSSMS
jgi:hypothetical protein